MMKNYWLSTHLIHLPNFSHRIKVEVGPQPKNTLTYPSCMVFNSVTELRASARIGRDAILISFINALLSMPVVKAPQGFNSEDHVKRSSHSSREEQQQCERSALTKRFEVWIKIFVLILHISSVALPHVCTPTLNPNPLQRIHFFHSHCCVALLQLQLQLQLEPGFD